jgi:hypothetical protein
VDRFWALRSAGILLAILPAFWLLRRVERRFRMRRLLNTVREELASSPDSALLALRQYRAQGGSMAVFSGEQIYRLFFVSSSEGAVWDALPSLSAGQILAAAGLLARDGATPVLGSLLSHPDTLGKEFGPVECRELVDLASGAGCLELVLRTAAKRAPDRAREALAQCLAERGWDGKVALLLGLEPPVPGSGGGDQPAPSSLPCLLTGFSGRVYVLESLLGEGGMGLVYKGVVQDSGQLVAVKKMRPEFRMMASVRKRFLREASIVERLSHPRIVKMHEAVVDSAGDVCLVLEYFEGDPLSEVLENGGPLPLGRARRIMEDVCGAVDFAHRNKVLHRDLKPSNIMVGGDGSAKVMDFGLAREARDLSAKTTSKDAWGTFAYMAPEQHLGRGREAADVFSLGVCLYVMLTGRLPFPGPDFLAQKERRVYEPVRALVPALPEGIDGVVAAALEPAPMKRIGPMELVGLLSKA